MTITGRLRTVVLVMLVLACVVGGILAFRSCLIYSSAVGALAGLRGYEAQNSNARIGQILAGTLFVVSQLMGGSGLQLVFDLGQSRFRGIVLGSLGCAIVTGCCFLLLFSLRHL